MAEPMPDHQLALLGDMADTCRDGWSPEDWDPDGLDAFLDLILAAVAEIDRIRADLEAAKQTIKAQKADMSTWAVRWQEQFDRAERAETADPGPSQPTDCSSDAAADLRGPEELLDAIKRLNVTTNGDDQIHVDITPLDPSPNAVNSVLLQWSLDGGWEHPPSGVSGTLGVMLHAIAVSALADGEQEGCGWGDRPEHLGASWPHHVADVYELAVANLEGAS